MVSPSFCFFLLCFSLKWPLPLSHSSCSVSLCNALSLFIHSHQLPYMFSLHWAVRWERSFGQFKSQQPRPHWFLKMGIWSEIWGGFAGYLEEIRRGKARQRHTRAMSVYQFLSLFMKMSWLGWERWGRIKYFRSYMHGLGWYCVLPEACWRASHVLFSVHEQQNVHWIFEWGYLHANDTGNTDL